MEDTAFSHQRRVKACRTVRWRSKALFITYWYFMLGKYIAYIFIQDACMVYYLNYLSFYTHFCFNLIKIQFFIILSFYYRMKIWQRPIVGHVQMTFIIYQSNRSLPDSESGSKALKVACMEYFDWLVKFPEMETTKVVCTWPPMGHCQIFRR